MQLWTHAGQVMSDQWQSKLSQPWGMTCVQVTYSWEEDFHECPAILPICFMLMQCSDRQEPRRNLNFRSSSLHSRALSSLKGFPGGAVMPVRWWMRLKGLYQRPLTAFCSTDNSQLPCPMPWQPQDGEHITENFRRAPLRENLQGATNPGSL